MGRGALYNADHLLSLRQERRDRQKNQDNVNDVKHKGLVRDLNTTNKNFILRSKNIGIWMKIRGTTVTDILFSAT